MEQLFVLGLVISALGYLWLLVTAFRESWKWGVGIILFAPLILLFLAKHFRKAIAPFNIVIAGLLITFSPALFSRLVPVDLGPHENVVNNELHLTLTGWDQKNYAVIARKPDTVVLQMANADVTDETLQYLDGLHKLRELDLSFSQVTDQGLSVIAKLPELETLFLQQVNMTDKGFEASLMNHPKLHQLNLSGTKVSPELIQKWMTDKPGRMALY